MRQMNKRKRVVSAIALMMAFLMTGSTLAYWTQELLAVNEFATARYETELKEEFVSPADWKPGQDVNKDVSVKNDGTIPVFAKLTIHQSWTRTANVLDGNGNPLAPTAGNPFPLSFDNAGSAEYAALIHWGSDVVVLTSGKANTTSLSLNLPSVTSAASAEGKWLLISETPDQDGNYTLYYIGTIAPGTETPLAVESVELNPAINASVIADDTVWDSVAGKWVTTYTNNHTSSYENARYAMTVTMHTVQATPDAVGEMFPSANTSHQSVVSHLKVTGFDHGDVAKSHDPNMAHELSFHEEHGRMVFNAVRGADENWFMSDLHMVPGGEYSYSLSINNKSEKTNALYMQAVPRSQTSALDELLHYLSMKVYYKGELLYEGTAMGHDYPSGSGNHTTLHNVIALGVFTPQDIENIQVEVTLDKNLPLEYAGLLTNIDWKFMIEEVEDPPLDPVPGPKPPQVPVTPKTGDILGDGTWYLAVMALSASTLLGCAFYLYRSKRRFSDTQSTEA